MSDPEFLGRHREGGFGDPESILEQVHRGKIDLILGEKWPLVLQFKSLVEERERLLRMTNKMAEEWQATFNAINDCIWILDPEQVIIRTNRVVERYFNRPAESVVGKYCWEILHNSGEPIPNCPGQRMKKSLKRETLEWNVDGKWYEIRVDPIRDSKGGLVGAVHVITDITERKSAEEALRDSQTELSVRNRLAHSCLTSQPLIVPPDLPEIIKSWLDSDTCLLAFRDEIGELLIHGLDPIKWKRRAENVAFKEEEWGEVLKSVLNSAEAMVLNQPSTLVYGLSVKRMLTVPLADQNKILGVLAVAGKSRDYDNTDLLRLRGIADYISPLLGARLREKQEKTNRQKAESEKAWLEEQYYQAQKMESIGREYHYWVRRKPPLRAATR